MKTAIILDLDDTIFQTRSMDKTVFKPFFDHFNAGLKPHFSEPVIADIIDDLWQNTWDLVLIKYNIPGVILMDAIEVLEKLDLILNISPYPDYAEIKHMTYPKFLVTTSLTSIQELKIKALGIESDFVKIVINDPLKGSKTKQDIFQELVSEFELVPECTYVIGDNADSEIKAGNALNMITVQMLRPGITKGTNANYYINSFEDLGTIINNSR